jgi:hypothetical protein
MTDRPWMAGCRRGGSVLITVAVLENCLDRVVVADRGEWGQRRRVISRSTSAWRPNWRRSRPARTAWRAATTHSPCYAAEKDRFSDGAYQVASPLAQIDRLLISRRSPPGLPGVRGPFISWPVTPKNSQRTFSPVFPSFWGKFPLCSRRKAGGKGSASPRKRDFAWAFVVGATGIEPVTPPA